MPPLSQCPMPHALCTSSLILHTLVDIEISDQRKAINDATVTNVIRYTPG
jgi:hypothetical protein